MSTINKHEREYKKSIRSSPDLTREEMTDHEKYLEDIPDCPRNVDVRIAYKSWSILSPSGMHDCDEETKKTIEKIERAHAEGKGLAIKLNYILGCHKYAAFPDPIDSKLSCSKCVNCGLISYFDEDHYELRKATLILACSSACCCSGVFGLGADTVTLSGSGGGLFRADNCCLIGGGGSCGSLCLICSDSGI